VKLLANENFPFSSVLYLRNKGYDITSIGEDYSGISDKIVLEIAESEQRIILTFDRDYGELIYKYNYKPTKGIIYLRIDTYEPTEPAVIVGELLQIHKIDTERMLTVFDGNTIRQRKY
jgi:predicted nuclease of predicted toxin-antitoxin system